MFDNFGQQLYDNIIANDRWLMYLEGAGNTLLMTIGAAILGIVIGCLVAICKVSYQQRNMGEIPKKTFGGAVMKVLNKICDIYVSLVRGIPMTVLLMIFVYIIFGSADLGMSLYIAIIAFGVNSGAYVAEIIRAGIMAVDRGQTEAGRSLGLTKGATMRLIVLPQAIKNILPALANEAITLLKETSIAGYAAIVDVTYNATLIRSRTFSPVPLIVIAVIYLVIVLIMTVGLKKIERSMAKSDYR